MANSRNQQAVDILKLQLSFLYNNFHFGFGFEGLDTRSQAQKKEWTTLLSLHRFQSKFFPIMSESLTSLEITILLKQASHTPPSIAPTTVYYNSTFPSPFASLASFEVCCCCCWWKLCIPSESLSLLLATLLSISEYKALMEPSTCQQKQKLLLGQLLRIGSMFEYSMLFY